MAAVDPAPTSAPRTARARARAELTAEIKAIARRHLAEHGADGLSLRAVARELGMVSSAIYRYFPSRDHLLTALIIDAYEALGTAAETAEDAADPDDLMARWLALAAGARRWALDHPHEWALIFGTPIPGYVAPQDTIDPAARIPVRLLALGTEAAARRGGPAPRSPIPVPRVLHRDLQAIAASAGVGLSDVELARGIAAWTSLVGTISFELFGHLGPAMTDHDAFFPFQMHAVGVDLGLA